MSPELGTPLNRGGMSFWIIPAVKKKTILIYFVNKRNWFCSWSQCSLFRLVKALRISLVFDFSIKKHHVSPSWSNQRKDHPLTYISMLQEFIFSDNIAIHVWMFETLIHESIIDFRNGIIEFLWLIMNRHGIQTSKKEILLMTTHLWLLEQSE